MSVSLEFIFGFVAGAFLAMLYYGVLQTFKMGHEVDKRVAIFMHVAFLFPLVYILYTLVGR